MVNLAMYEDEKDKNWVPQGEGDYNDEAVAHVRSAHLDAEGDTPQLSLQSIGPKHRVKPPRKRGVAREAPTCRLGKRRQCRSPGHI